jgi:predicted RNase H-like nuclease (RuvC/YqgF family)
MRPFPILLGLSLISAPLGLGAADIDAEDFRRLVDRVNSHDEAIDAYRNTIQDLRSEVARLRGENDRLKTVVNTPKNYATQEQITKLRSSCGRWRRTGQRTSSRCWMPSTS